MIETPTFSLTEENYYGKDANKVYMSCSQFKRFDFCEFAALQEIMTDFKEAPSTALLVGSYVDAALDGSEAFEKFIQTHPEIFKKDGTPKADFVIAQDIVDRVRRDELAMMLLDGEKQVILDGFIEGVPFRGKCDVVLDRAQCLKIMERFPETAEVLGGPFAEGCIVDFKTARDYEDKWKDGAYVNWIDFWRYDLQGAIYRELYHQKYGKTLPFVILSATKEPGTAIDAVFIPHNVMDAALREVEVAAPTYQKIKLGLIEPHRCENCKVCRETRKLTKIRNYKEVTNA